MGTEPEANWANMGWTKLPNVNKAFICPDAPEDTSSPANTWRLTYAANPRILPDNGQKDGANLNLPMHVRSTGDIRNGAEKMMAFDSGVDIEGGYGYSSYMNPCFFIHNFLIDRARRWCCRG